MDKIDTITSKISERFSEPLDNPSPSVPDAGGSEPTPDEYPIGESPYTPISQHIWKYTLKDTGTTEIVLPAEALVLTAAMQDDVISLWCLVTADMPMVKRSFQVVGTGWPIEPMKGIRRQYINTVLTKCSRLVWHVFELKKY